MSVYVRVYERKRKRTQVVMTTKLWSNVKNENVISIKCM